MRELSGLKRLISKWSSMTAVMLAVSLLLIVFAVVPLVMVLVRAFSGESGVDVSPLIEAWGDGRTWSLLETSLTLALGTSVFTVALGVPAAWLLARTDVPGAKTLKTALSLPYVIPPYILAIGWITLLNPRSGVVNTLLMSEGAETGPINIYSLFGMIFCLGLAYYPLVMLQVHSALEGMDPSLEEAARTSGAGPLRVLFTVTLPLAMPAIGSGALLTFLVGMASFGVPYLVGSPGRVEVLTTSIYTAIDVNTDASIARAVAFALLLGLVAALALVLNGLLIKKGRALLGGKAGRPSLVNLTRWRTPVAGLLWGLVAFAVGVPVLTLITTSFLGSWGKGLALENLSIINYTTVFSDPRTLDAVFLSGALAAAAATIVVILGTLASVMRKRTRLPGRNLLPFLAELPYAVPGTVLAMGFIFTFSQELWIYIEEVIYVRVLLFNTAWILLVAYSVKFLAFGVRTSDAALTQIDPSMEEAARTSGAGPLRTFGQITVPLVRQALVAAWVLVFLPAIGEITMSIMLFGPETRTVGVLLFDYQTYESPPKAAVLGTLLVVTIIFGNLLVKRLTGGKLGL